MTDRAHSLILAVLSLIVILVWAGMNYLFFTRGVQPAVDPGIFNRILGTMDAAVLLILNYWFGSNKDAATNAAMLYRSTPREAADSGKLPTQ